MIKIRMMGTKNDIKWFQKILGRCRKVKVIDVSDLYTNKGTNRYYRAYAEIEKNDEAKDDEAKERVLNR